mgnify:CR=1 FL=1
MRKSFLCYGEVAMSRDINPFGLRMPLELRTQITDAAAANGRSLNSEIVARLQASFEPRQDGNRFQRAFELPEELQVMIETMVDNIIARANGEPRKEYKKPKR